MNKPTDSVIKVLLIDDDEDDFVLTKYIFDDFKAGEYQLDWVNSYQAGLTAMMENRGDIYLVDYRLGAESGLSLMREAKRCGCKSPIILLTGQGDKEIDYKAMEAGATDYLIKGDLDAKLLERSIRYGLRHARAMEKMQSSETKFRSVIQSASDAIFLVSGEGSVTLWNAAAEKIFGYAEAEIIGKPATLLMGAKYAAKAAEVGLRKTVEEILAPMSGVTIQAVGRRKDSSEFPLEMSGSVWDTPDGSFYTAIIRDITERKKAGESLKESEERYRELFENANDLIYLHDLEGNFISINQTGTRVFGYTIEEAMTLNIAQIVAPEHLEYARKQIAAKVSGAPSSSYEIDCIRKDGRRVSFEINSRVIYDQGKPVSVQGIARDITDRKLAEAERDRLYNVSNDLLATVGFDGKITHINPAWEVILGYAKKDLIGAEVCSITHEDDRQAMVEKSGYLKTGENVSFESRLRCKDNSYRWILWSSTPVVTDSIAYVVGRDITERKRTEEILRHNALFDKLTNLPNRAQFMHHLQTAVDDFKNKTNAGFAVLFLDLDRFKIINDGLGHLIGDKLLVAISERIKNSLRPGDIVARFGGDEFTVLVHNIFHTTDATSVAERIQEQLSKPFKLNNYEVFSSASIGIIIADETRLKPEDFLRDADTAMYRAKAAGKAGYQIFDSAMHTRNLNILQIENDLRRAIEREEFRVFYQPVVNLQTGEISEFESLVRWFHPEKGLIMPNDFIPVAEETGMIAAIDRWVLTESCRQINDWQQRFGRRDTLSLSVNLSTKQLINRNLTKQIYEMTRAIDLDPRCLKLEVTETSVMENAETALQILSELCAYGIRISSDDFGTGYSSLSYLHRFPFERLKIDRSFIGRMDTDSKSEEIVRTILTLAENLHLEVVAEGVENERQFRRLRELGCSYGQGYLFSKPVAANEAEKLLGKKFGNAVLSGVESGAEYTPHEKSVIEVAKLQ